MESMEKSERDKNYFSTSSFSWNVKKEEQEAASSKVVKYVLDLAGQLVLLQLPC